MAVIRSVLDLDVTVDDASWVITPRRAVSVS
jgi:hypothetical protein